MPHPKLLPVCFSIVGISALLCVAGCTHRSDVQHEPTHVATEQPIKPPSPPRSTPVLPIQQVALNPVVVREAPKVAPPKPEDVNEVVTRVYESAVTPVPGHDPAFLVGDFNGDGSEDLAILVKPNEAKLADLNSELANWILEDPNAVPIPGLPSTSQRSARDRKHVLANKADVLLAIVHGVGSQGWRNTEAKQTFLLKNGVGSAMSAKTAKDLRSDKTKPHLPPLRGDAIKEAVAGKSGFIFWTGAKYAWYSADLDLP